MIRRFAGGQLGPLERKSLEPIADLEGVEPRALQLFFSRNEGDEEEALKRHQQRVASELSRREGIFIIDETSDAKKGQWTAGVGRQYCGESGKIDNCIVSVHTAYACDDVHGLLDGELFLPESWNPDDADAAITLKRARAKIAEEIVHQPKTELAMGQIKRARANGAGYFAAKRTAGTGNPNRFSSATPLRWRLNAISKSKVKPIRMTLAGSSILSADSVSKWPTISKDVGNYCTSGRNKTGCARYASRTLPNSRDGIIIISSGDPAAVVIMLKTGYCFIPNAIVKSIAEI